MTTKTSMRRIAFASLFTLIISPMVFADPPATQASTQPASTGLSCPYCGTGISIQRLLRQPRAFNPAATTKPTDEGDATLKGMVRIPGGTFWMGSDDARFRDASPVHQVRVDGFWIDRTDVTNVQFEKFVNATGYVTIAEKKPDPATVPGVAPELLVAGAVVFTKPEGPVALNDPSQWWRYVAGASWRHPEGPDSGLKGREDHPVVDIAWDDAVAYANWSHKRLPTEAEWEYAARGGLDRKPYVWGDQFKPGEKFMANYFQGHFPDDNTGEDGFPGTSPVGSFPPNGYGLYDMAGNVWQWCSDWYRPDYYALLSAASKNAPSANPTGPDSAYDPDEPQVAKRVMKGGSYLCTDQYCGRFMPGSRGKGDPDTPLNHVGFRCVASLAAEPNGSADPHKAAAGAKESRNDASAAILQLESR
jgi:formylglycine-generating enzyme